MLVFQESQSDNKHYEPLINALRSIPQPSKSVVLSTVSMSEASKVQLEMQNNVILLQYFVFYRHKTINRTEQKSYQAELWPLIEFILLINNVISRLPYQTSKQQHAQRRVAGNALTA